MRHLPARGAAVLVVAALLTTPPAVAQAERPFPMVPGPAVAAADGLPVLQPVPAEIAALADESAVLLSGLPVPGGDAVDLVLEAIDLDRLGFGFQVDGRPAPDLLDGLDLSVWTGSVAGEAGSEAVVSFSRAGVRGWVRTGGQLVHLLPQPAADGDWSAGHSILAREADLVARGLELSDYCGVDDLAAMGRERDALPFGAGEPPDGPAGFAGTACAAWECAIAVETDWQLFQVFGDLAAETAYVTTLLAAVSDRYQEQIDTTLVYPYVQFYTTSADPWSTPESGGDMIDMLGEFETAWGGNVPAGAILGHFLSGAPLGGGVAYLGVLCDTSETFSFAVSGNIDGSVPFPVAQGPLNWDFMVFAHETGHNFNSPHTHDYVPQIDNCAGGDCITDGTIMSYCHLCPGGLSNITTFFYEPTVVDVMKAHAAACLPSQLPLEAEATAQPSLVAPGSPTTLTVASPTGVAAADLNYRFSSGAAFSTVAMTDQGGGTFTGDLPAASCGDEPEWFFSATDPVCGFFQTETFSADVGVSTEVLFDDFEGAATWTVGAAGDDATTGVWELGNPIGTGAQPEDDVSSPGTDCWFTGQGSVGGSLGENDVDGGKTTLVSELIDASVGGDVRIGYWRWYSNDTGNAPNADVFEVEISNDGSSWVDVETVGPSGAGTSGGWMYHEFAVADFVAPNSTVQLRFIASDEGDGSIVEAAVDDVSVFTVDCDDGEVCQTDIGFGGPGTATLTMCGGDLSTGTTADLTLTGATPGGTAFFFAGVVNSPTPLKGGQLVPVPWILSFPVALDGSGSVTLANLAGGFGPLTVYVQAVYADAGQPEGYGLSNALQVEYLP